MTSWNSARLSLYSSDLKLAELTAKLGPPAQSRDVGQVGRSGHRAPFTLWSWESAVRSDSMEELIADVVAFAEEHRAALSAWGELIHKKRIFCGVFLSGRPDPPGFSISANLLSRIGALDLDLDVDIL